MSAHLIAVRGRTQRYGWQSISFGCPDCDLHGRIRTAPAAAADRLLALLTAQHRTEGRRADG